MLERASGWSTGETLRWAVLGLMLAVLGTVPVASGAGAQEDPLRIVSLGDSYISGTGADAYEEGQGPGIATGGSRDRNDQSGVNCYQSRRAFPWQYAEALDRIDVDAVVRHAACHGARVRDLRDQWGTVGDSSSGSSSEFLDPDIVLLSIGGNDAGFSTMVESCLVFVFQISACQRVLDSAERDIEGIIQRIETEVLWLHDQAPNAKIALVTYPHLTSPTCVLNVAASRRIRALQEEHVLLANALAGRVNGQLGQRVVEVVDPSAAFDGRGPCALRDRLLHRVNLEIQESFHPTREGHQTYADVLVDSGLHTRLLEPATPAPAGPSVDPESFEEFAATPGLHRGHSIVLRLYWAVLDRVPDVEGARFWVGAYDSGDWSTRRIARHFVVSAEFAQTYGSELSDEAFVQLVYRNVLEREPDDEGRGFWVGQLEAGMERAEMILLISNDAEFIADRPLPSDRRPNSGPRG